MVAVMRKAAMAAGVPTLLGMLAFPAAAAEPKPWQLGFQQPASVGKEMLHGFHDMLLVIITLITLFVLALLVYVMVKFNAKANPKPSRTTHNTLIEVLWTVVPIVILVVIAVPSFRILYTLDKTTEAEMTIKVTGNQWFWNYGYPDHGNFAFDSLLLEGDDLKDKSKRLLEVDNRLVVPVDTAIRLTFHGNDVMHSWYVPALGVQMYTVPGHVNETWMKVTRTGVFYGQCNQICGVRHGYMPIAIEVKSKADFAAWVEQAKTKFAAAPLPAPKVMLAQAPAN
ncbi:MAG: cytochrome c oxidase subunit II [Thalassobaculales bacterium]